MPKNPSLSPNDPQELAPGIATKATDFESKGIESLAKNAVRLLADAQLLFDNNRYPSCLSLAVLALEEAGKYFMLESQRSERGKNSLDHSAKQSLAGSAIIADTLIRVLDKFLDDHGYELKRDENLSQEQKDWLSSPAGLHAQDLLYRGELGAKIIENTAQALSDSTLSSALSHALQGKFNFLKKKSLYVDIEADGTAKSDPADITKRDAELALAAAAIAINPIDSDQDNRLAKIKSVLEGTVRRCGQTD